MESVKKNAEVEAKEDAKPAATADKKVEASEKAEIKQTGDSHSCCGTCS